MALIEIKIDWYRLERIWRKVTKPFRYEPPLSVTRFHSPITMAEFAAMAGPAMRRLKDTPVWDTDIWEKKPKQPVDGE